MKPYLSIVIPPGLLVLDVDNSDEFDETGLEVPPDAPRYMSISQKETNGREVIRKLRGSLRALAMK